MVRFCTFELQVNLRSSKEEDEGHELRKKEKDDCMGAMEAQIPRGEGRFKKKSIKEGRVNHND